MHGFSHNNTPLFSDITVMIKNLASVSVVCTYIPSIVALFLAQMPDNLNVTSPFVQNLFPNNCQSIWQILTVSVTHE